MIRGKTYVLAELTTGGNRSDDGINFWYCIQIDYIVLHTKHAVMFYSSVVFVRNWM